MAASEVTKLTLKSAPAEVAVFPKLVKFDSSIFDGETPYQGPPNAVNEKLWAELYAGSCLVYLGILFPSAFQRPPCDVEPLKVAIC